MLPPDIKDAELAVIRAASRSTIYDSANVNSLRDAVQGMTRLLKDHGLPPERALVYLKGAAFKARLSYSELPGENAEYVNQLLSKTLEWFLESYFDDGKEPALK